MSDAPMIVLWEGRPLDGMTKEELIAIVLAQEKNHREQYDLLKSSRDMWVRSAYR